MVFFKGDNPAGFVDRNEFVGSFLSGSIDVDPTTGNPATNPYELVVGEALNANTIWGLYDANGNGDFGSWSENAQGGVDMVFDDGEWTVDSAAYTFGGDLPYFTGTGMSGDLPSLDFDTSYAVGPVEGLPGDANDDGAVDEDDLEIFKSQFGLSGEGLSADFNDDGRCGLDDFAIMRSNFGATSAPEAAPVYGASSSMAMETKARPGREYNPVPVIETSIAVTSASTDVDVLASATPIYTDFPAPAAIPSFEDGSNSQTVLPSAGSLGSSLEDKVDRDSSSIVTSFSTDSSIQESDSTSTATMASATSSSSSVLNVIDSGADVMEAIYGDYDATATSGVDNVSNLGFTVDGDSNDTNKYSMVFFKGDNPAGFVDRNEFVGSFLSGSIDVDPTTSNPAVNPYELVVGEALNPGTIWGLYDANSDGDFGSWSLNGLGGTDITFDDGELTLDPAAFNFGGPLPHFTGTGMSGDLPSLDFDTSYAVPEPSTLSLLAIGGAALASKKRRK
ncbi:PEP-CTERM sorting domain-containing protein, partial [archaeon]|nr:PEP-CTERM sorting domain-containing protein [archaeon]